MDNEQRLQKAFEYVRKTFFPRWDKKSEWIVIHDSKLPCPSKCRSEDKTIVVQFVPQNDGELKLLLIHEICHSSASGHGKKWSSRMLKTATRTEKAGWSNFADLIKNDVKRAEGATSVNASMVYGFFPFAIDDKLDESYEDFINYVAREFGMYPDEFEKRFKQCRKVYNKAVKEYKAYRVEKFKRGDHGNNL